MFEKVGLFLYGLYDWVFKKGINMSTRSVQVVCAVSEKQYIFGEGDQLPWKFAKPNEDFRRFVLLTKGAGDRSVIMGRHTWESLPPTQRPLKERRNFVVTRNTSYIAEGAQVCSSLDEALAAADTPIVSIIGGVEIIKEAITRRLVNAVSLTRVCKNFPTTDQTRFFPQLLSDEFFFPMVCVSVDRHTQPLQGGGSVDLEFRHYW